MKANTSHHKRIIGTAEAPLKRRTDICTVDIMDEGRDMERPIPTTRVTKTSFYVEPISKKIPRLQYRVLSTLKESHPHGLVYGGALENISSQHLRLPCSKAHISIGASRRKRFGPARPRFLPGIDGETRTNPLWIFGDKVGYIQAVLLQHVRWIAATARRSGGTPRSKISVFSPLPTRWHWIGSLPGSRIVPFR